MDIAEALQQAAASYRRGHLAEAKSVYEKILEVDPKNFDGLHLLGLIAFQQGDFQTAIDHLERALAVNATVADVFNVHGGALSLLQRYDAALESFNRAVTLAPNHAEAINNRGGALAALDRHAEAIAAFDHLITRDAGNIDALISRGKSRAALGRSEEAVEDFDRAIALAPANADAHYNRGVVLWGTDRRDLAVASFDRAAALQPDNVTVHWNHALSLSAAGLYKDAAASLERVIALDPDNADAHNELGLALQALWNLDGALASFNRAVAINPAHFGAHNNRALALFRAKRYTEALESWDRAIAIAPQSPPAQVNRALALEALGRVEEAIACYDKALAIDPLAKFARGKRLHDCMRIGRWDGFEAEVQAVLRDIEASHLVAAPFPVLALPSTPAQQLKVAQLRRLDSPAPENRSWPAAARARAKLRIGYFSADFRSHATSALISGLITSHDRAHFEIIGFSFWPFSDDDMMMRQMGAAFDRFIDVSATSDEGIAALARDLEIDIALDLMGDTTESRSGVFMHGAAPVQVTYLGYPATMGSTAFDYIIADSVLIPPQHRRYYAEKVAYLPHTYQPNDSRRAISDRILTRTDLGLPVEAFVFCAFNGSFKITPAVFDIWMRLLCKVKGSILWLLEGPDPFAANLRREAERRGVSGDRLIFAPRIKPEEHLARHRAADLFLDTFYCCAHTSASDALWAGLPVLSLLGETFAGRVAASLLAAIGLEELVARTPADYEKMALELARDEDRLAQLRLHLEDHRLVAPLFDTARYTRNIEAAYRHMWETYRRNEKAGPFRVVDNGTPTIEIVHGDT